MRLIWFDVYYSLVLLGHGRLDMMACFGVIFTVAVVSEQASMIQEPKNKKPLCTCTSLWF